MTVRVPDAWAATPRVHVVRDDLAARPAPEAGRVAVLVPVYQDDGRLAATLESLRAQTAPFAAVLVDDGSATPLAVAPADAPFPTVILRLERNQGIEAALNAGLAYVLAAGFAYVARLDNGDTSAPDRLARQLALLDAHPEVGLVGSAVAWVDRAGREVFRLDPPTEDRVLRRALHHTVPIIHPTAMLRASVLRAVGPYSTAHPAAEDYDLFWRMADRSALACVPEVLVATQFDPAGISQRRRARQLASRWRIQCARFRAGEPLAWYGLLKTGALRALPYGVVVQLKRLRRPRPRTGPSDREPAPAVRPATA